MPIAYYQPTMGDRPNPCADPCSELCRGYAPQTAAAAGCPPVESGQAPFSPPGSSGPAFAPAGAAGTADARFARALALPPVPSRGAFGVGGGGGGGAPDSPPMFAPAQEEGLSTGAMVAIGLGGAAVVGLGAYLVLRKRRR
jgi:hypothetical protein